ncbi:hypothetical protein Pan44_06850 [Caulifigura coniformis]|uniref:PEP-CTERM protein-sorting domain-containing protein n=1 Tax=Caulifigura coniformis TaxID=2527983 RepID=A0A517S983_9PLAN|nr:hypothetical protein [Caulifigura coniformis]QDT52673.1 hypothetical protein Pan44_06850 [Caulifigura coniformis]
MRLFAYSLTACLVCTGSLLAHPGHGVTEGDSTMHYLVEPIHIAPVVLLLVAGFGVGLWLKRRRNSLKRVPVRKQ